MTEIYVIVGLVILNIAQFIYWAWQNNVLINKLMCRDLAEYKRVTEPIPDQRSFREYEQEHEEKEILSELNSMLPS